MLAKQGIAMSVDRAHRLWKGAELQVPKKRPRKRVAAGPASDGAVRAERGLVVDGEADNKFTPLRTPITVR